MSEKKAKFQPKDVPTGGKILLDGMPVTYLRPCKSMDSSIVMMPSGKVDTVANGRLTDGRPT